MELARSRNSTPLPLIKTHCGLRLPPERHCLLSANYKLRAAEILPKRLTKSALDRSSGKGKANVSTNLKRQSIPNATKKQIVSIPKPTFKVSSNVNGKFNGGPGPSGSSMNFSSSSSYPMKVKTEIKMEIEDEYSNDSRGTKRRRDEEQELEYEEEFES